MPSINIPIGDLTSTVERPVIYDIIRQMQDLTGISSKTPVHFYGDDAKAPQWNSQQVGGKYQSDNLWPHMENITIEVDEDYTPDRLISSSIKQPDNPFIFIDEEVGTYIKPVYSATDVVIRVKFKARDKNQANRWRNEIRTRTGMNRDINMHEITYSYHLPEEYLGILENLYTLKENINGTGESFKDWFFNHASDRIGNVSDLAGKNVILVVSEKAAGIQGLFDFEGVPDKPEKEDDHEVWTIGFSYKFKYEKPINTVMYYSNFIHQQAVAKKYLGNAPAYSLQNVWKNRPTSAENFAFFQEDNRIFKAMANKGLAIPSFDEFIPRNIPSTTLKVFTIVTFITPTDKRSLFNLRHLGEFNLDEEVLNFIAASEYPYITKSFNSIFNLHLYENTNIVEDGILTVDSDLNVNATADLDLNKTYRVRLSMGADMSYLTAPALSRLKDFPTVRDKVVSAINLALGSSGNQTDLMKNKLREIDYILLGTKPGNNLMYGSSLAQALFVVANRLSNYTAETASVPVAILPDKQIR